MRGSSHLIGLVNFASLLLAITILGGGIWLNNRAETDCFKFLQWPIIIIGVSIFAVSLAGIVGAYCRYPILIQFFLLAMLLLLAALIGVIVFAHAVTSKGSGRPLKIRAYSDYYLEDFNGWLKRRVSSINNWNKIQACIASSGVCAKMRKTINGVPETAVMFYHRKLTPIQSGCCKPPTDCGYTYVNETTWYPLVVTQELDCLQWNNDQHQLCYACDSCKAGVLASIKTSWRKVSAMNLVVLIILLLLYVVCYMAFRRNRMVDDHSSHGQAKMEKLRPRTFF